MDTEANETTCLICGKPAASRQLCTAHYLRFTRKRKEIPEHHREAWEAAIIADGKLGQNDRGKKASASSDPFEDHYAKFLDSQQKAAALAAKIPGVRIPTKEEIEKSDQLHADIENPIHVPVGKQGRRKAAQKPKVQSNSKYFLNS